MPPSSSFCSSCCSAMAHAAGSCAAACSASSFASALADASSMLRSHVCCGVGSVVAKLGGAFSLVERMSASVPRPMCGSSSEAGQNEKNSHPFVYDSRRFPSLLRAYRCACFSLTFSFTPPARGVLATPLPSVFNIIRGVRSHPRVPLLPHTRTHTGNRSSARPPQGRHALRLVVVHAPPPL
jgi:hypothetical protein